MSLQMFSLRCGGRGRERGPRGTYVLRVPSCSKIGYCCFVLRLCAARSTPNGRQRAGRSYKGNLRMGPPLAGEKVEKRRVCRVGRLTDLSESRHSGADSSGAFGRYSCLGVMVAQEFGARQSTRLWNATCTADCGPPERTPSRDKMFVVTAHSDKETHSAMGKNRKTEWGVVVGRAFGILVLVTGILFAAGLCTASPPPDNSVPSIFDPRSTAV
jgi:hypothetical protein